MWWSYSVRIHRRSWLIANANIGIRVASCWPWFGLGPGVAGRTTMKWTCIALCLIAGAAHAEDEWYTITRYGDRCRAEDPVLQEQKLMAANDYLQTVTLKAPDGEVVDKIIVSRGKKGYVYFRNATVCEYARREALARGWFKQGT